jgi:hypothetical protein
MKKSIVIFNGGDYELISFIPYLSKYICQCTDASIQVDLLCKNVKIFDDFVRMEIGLNRVFLSEDLINVDDYNFKRQIRVVTNSSCDEFYKSICNSLGITYTGPLSWLDIESTGYIVKFIKKASLFQLKSYNAIFFSNADRKAHGDDLIRPLITIESQPKPLLLFGPDLYTVHGLKINNVTSLILIAAFANSFFGSDGILSQICINLGIPSCVIVRDRRIIKIRTSMPNVLYKDQVNAAKMFLEFSGRYWQLQDDIVRSKH